MIPDKFIPLIYFTAVVAAAIALHYAGIDKTVAGAIIGAGLMRVKIPAPPNGMVKPPPVTG